MFLGIKESALEDHLGLIDAERREAEKLDDMLERLSCEMLDMNGIITKTRKSLKRVQNDILKRSEFLIDLRDKNNQLIQWEEFIIPQKKDITF